ncbi:MAG: DUF541 domain-containing protein [Candidatus Dadabacteria bacterium]|nr:DUF541 domain-containing protein [Candidatus Dadabacteria bacterium]NIS09007.1 DUF541 domain-containing protein [Candidatus Dadabacteria bacterium]NIV41050.1 DUF541 domain-containing protein [Candidatus Dadabacteria bacterium]NIX15610.1 DUF541 domain-containing protein [Candidatus Dadabacteria bacterium]NIY22351.1 DUF541 domain-containing protein [Candidatus Dadabacteria bacterium]
MIIKTVYILNILFFAFVFGNLAFADDDDKLLPKLQVTGKGEVMVKPDTAFVTVTVETTALTASEAAQQNANKMQSVLKVVKSIIGKKDKVTTARYNLSPKYEYNKTTKKSELTGYTSANSLNIETKKINKLGQIIDKSISAGANNVGSINFSASEQEIFRKEALVKAVKDARKTAEVVAGAAGVKIVKILNISPSYHYPLPIRRDYKLGRTMAAESVPTPIEAGELTVTANVNMVFEIE